MSDEFDKWQTETLRRIEALGHSGFQFFGTDAPEGRIPTWLILDENEEPFSRPLYSTQEVDEWLTEREG